MSADEFRYEGYVAQAKATKGVDGWLTFVRRERKTS
jgi:hypothetical protein